MPRSIPIHRDIKSSSTEEERIGWLALLGFLMVNGLWVLVLFNI